MLYQWLGFTHLTSTLKSHLQYKVLCQFLLLPTFLFVWWSGSLLYLRRASGTEWKSLGVISCEGIILYQTQRLLKVCAPPSPPKQVVTTPTKSHLLFYYHLHLWVHVKIVKLVCFADLFLQQGVTILSHHESYSHRPAQGVPNLWRKGFAFLIAFLFLLQDVGDKLYTCTEAA